MGGEGASSMRSGSVERGCMRGRPGRGEHALMGQSGSVCGLPRQGGRALMTRLGSTKRGLRASVTRVRGACIDRRGQLGEGVGMVGR